ncbi:MAG: TonB C-terminal domain-containing protein [Oligoflexia bacterium]|nr:TonB C-terminal domain-containing protein [Oligoflexia bacterium]
MVRYLLSLFLSILFHVGILFLVLTLFPLEKVQVSKQAIPIAVIEVRVLKRSLATSSLPLPQRPASLEKKRGKQLASERQTLTPAPEAISPVLPAPPAPPAPPASLRSDEVEARFSEYIATVGKKIKKKFTLLLPREFNQDLVCVVVLKLNQDGSVKNSAILQSSGKEEYDQLVLRAIENSAPFAEVPEECIPEISERGLEVNFKLR